MGLSAEVCIGVEDDGPKAVLILAVPIPLGLQGYRHETVFRKRKVCGPRTKL